MKRNAIVLLAVGVIMLVPSFVLCAEQEPWKPDEELSQEIAKPEPYGGVEKALESLDQLNRDGKHRDALAEGLMLTARYWEDRLPFLQRCAWSLAALEKWNDCVGAYDLIENTAKSGERIRGVTEVYVGEAVVNLAALHSRPRHTSVPESLFDADAASRFAKRVLKDFPNEEIVFWGEFQGWSHQEATLALAAASEAAASLKPLYEQASAKDSKQRRSVDKKTAVPYTFLALEQWSEAKDEVGTDAVEIAPFLGPLINSTPDPPTQGLGYIIMGRVNERIPEHKATAYSVYKRASELNFPLCEQVWKPYRQEAQEALQKLAPETGEQ